MTLKAILTFSVAAILVTACASAPDPQPQDIIPVANNTQPEVFQPLPPIIDAPDPNAQARLVAPSTPSRSASTSSVPEFFAPTPGSRADFQYQFGLDSRIYFGYDESALNTESRDILRRQASWLNNYSSATAIVEGNADERGTREYNLALGARRANSVKAFLVSQGVAPRRLTTVSYGKERPIEGGSDEYSWSRNRNGNTNINVSRISG